MSAAYGGRNNVVARPVIVSSKSCVAFNSSRTCSGQASASVIIGPVGYMGVQIRDLNSQIAAQYGLSVDSGALVWAVQTGSPAEQAGMTRLSVITAVGSTSVSSAATLGTAIHAYKPGASVAVTWVDQNGASHTKNLTLVAGPNI